MNWEPVSHKALTYERLKEFLIAKKGQEGASEIQKVLNNKECLTKDFFTSTNFRYVHTGGDTPGIYIYQYSVGSSVDAATKYVNKQVVIEPDIDYYMPNAPQPTKWKIYVQTLNGTTYNGNSYYPDESVIEEEVADGTDWTSEAFVPPLNQEGTLIVKEGNNYPSLSPNNTVTLHVTRDYHLVSLFTAAYKIKIQTDANSQYNGKTEDTLATVPAGGSWSMPIATITNNLSFSTGYELDEITVPDGMVKGDTNYSVQNATKNYVIQVTSKEIESQPSVPSRVEIIEGECFSVNDVLTPGQTFRIIDGNNNDLSSNFTTKVESADQLQNNGEYYIEFKRFEHVDGTNVLSGTWHIQVYYNGQKYPEAGNENKFEILSCPYFAYGARVEGASRARLTWSNAIGLPQGGNSSVEIEETQTWRGLSSIRFQNPTATENNIITIDFFSQEYFEQFKQGTIYAKLGGTNIKITDIQPKSMNVEFTNISSEIDCIIPSSQEDWTICENLTSIELETYSQDEHEYVPYNEPIDISGLGIGYKGPVNTNNTYYLHQAVQDMIPDNINGLPLRSIQIYECKVIASYGASDYTPPSYQYRVKVIVTDMDEQSTQEYWYGYDDENATATGQGLLVYHGINNAIINSCKYLPINSSSEENLETFVDSQTLLKNCEKIHIKYQRKLVRCVKYINFTARARRKIPSSQKTLSIGTDSNSDLECSATEVTQYNHGEDSTRTIQPMSIGTIQVVFKSSIPGKSTFTINWENIKYDNCDENRTASYEVDFETY